MFTSLCSNCVPPVMYTVHSTEEPLWPVWPFQVGSMLSQATCPITPSPSLPTPFSLVFHFKVSASYLLVSLFSSFSFHGKFNRINSWNRGEELGFKQLVFHRPREQTEQWTSLATQTLALSYLSGCQSARLIVRSTIFCSYQLSNKRNTKIIFWYYYYYKYFWELTFCEAIPVN